MNEQILMENEIKKSNTKSIIAIIAIVIIFIGLLFVTFSYFNSPKKRMVDGINKFFNDVTEKLENKKLNSILNNDIVGIEGETTLNLSGSIVDETLKLFNNTTVKYNYIEDKTAKKASLDFDTTINNEQIIGLYGLIKDSKVYFNIKNLINKYYFFECDFIELLKSSSIKDAEYIINIFRNTVIENLNDDSFSKSNATIKVDGKDEKVEKITFKFDDKYILDIFVDFMKKVKEDEKALNIILDMSEDIKKDKLIKSINYLIEDSKEYKATQEFMFNVYVKDYLVSVKYELESNETKVSYYSYRNNKEFSLLDNGVEYVNINIKDNKDINGTIMMIPIKGTYSDNKFDLNINYMNVDCNLSIYNDEEYKTDSVSLNSKIVVNVKDKSNEYLKLTIDSKFTISKFDKINELNIQLSTDINKITDEDQNTMLNKLSEMTIFKKLIGIYEQEKNMLEENVNDITL